jgi:hypothetical protein
MPVPKVKLKHTFLSLLTVPSNWDLRLCPPPFAVDRTAVCSVMFEHHSRPAPEGVTSSEDPEDHHHPKPCREYRQVWQGESGTDRAM